MMTRGTVSADDRAAAAVQLSGTDAAVELGESLWRATLLPAGASEMEQLTASPHFLGLRFAEVRATLRAPQACGLGSLACGSTELLQCSGHGFQAPFPPAVTSRPLVSALTIAIE